VRREPEAGGIDRVTGAQPADRGRESLEAALVQHPGGEEVVGEPGAVEETGTRR
jgi:hypothetical protein